jgi:hypothetical protein
MRPANPTADRPVTALRNKTVAKIDHELDHQIDHEINRSRHHQLDRQIATSPDQHIHRRPPALSKAPDEIV